MKKLLQNRKKGFTLVELIVVIVIIAILIAALTPAIMGVINRANISADQADLRTLLAEAQAWGINSRGMIETNQAIQDHINTRLGSVGINGIVLHFVDGENSLPTGASVGAAQARSREGTSVGTQPVVGGPPEPPIGD